MRVKLRTKEGDTSLPQERYAKNWKAWSQEERFDLIEYERKGDSCG